MNRQFIFLALAFAAAAAQASVLMVGKTDKPPLSYKCGEEIKFEVKLVNGKDLPAGAKMRWSLAADDGQRREGVVAPPVAAPFEIATKMDKPGFVRLLAVVVGEDGKDYQQDFAENELTPDGKRPMNKWEKAERGVFFDGGAAVEPEKLKSMPEPKDFDKFWAKQLARLAKVPMKVRKVEAKSCTPDVKIYIVEIACAGKRPVTGELSIPTKPGKYPALLEVDGYGIYAPDPNHERGAIWRPADKIILHINAHGFNMPEFGADAAYYEALKKELEGYAFDKKENSDPETTYWNGMALRVVRALQFLEKLKAWNGKDLEVHGGSQGGLQTMWGVALDPKVSRATPYVTWCCDLASREKQGRMGGWRPEWQDALGYYDPVNMAKRVRRTQRVDIERVGLGDYIAPPSTVQVLYNNLKCPKSVKFVQGSNHGYVPPEEFREECVFTGTWNGLEKSTRKAFPDNAFRAVEPPAPCGPLPTERQLWWQDLETYAFIHYSLNTYTDQEWGFGNEDPKLFNPERLDARQWARVCRESGMKGAILTAKHHCGFCLWPSKYTDYSVKSSPWKGGKGDVVREFADACRAEGIKFAVYLSPWDRNHPEYGRPAYVEYFRNQLKELLTEYGDVFEVWFDGANGGNGWYGGANETRRIDKSYYGWEETFKMIRKLQPDALIWNDGGARGDLRWIGNEAGCCGERNWSLLNATGDVSGGELNSGREDGDSWVPGETNTSIRPGWFHHYAEDGHVKSLSKLMDIYYKSVGRNSTLLLNFPISPDGLIPEEDAKRGAAFAKAVKEAFKEDLAKGAKATADNVRGKCAAYSASNAVDGNPETYWATDDGVTRAALTVDFGKPTTFNRVVACEYIRLGQRVRRFSMEAFVGGEWREIRDALGGHDAQTTVGRKRILCVPATTATKLRFTVLDAKACPLISTLGVYNAPELTADIPDSGEKRCGMYHVFFAGPRQMNIDLGGVKKICGFRYKPPRDGKNGVVTHYSLSSTVDWAKWEKLASGEFSNVVNNPIWQTVKFKPVDAGIVSFTADCLAEGGRLRYDDFEFLFEK